MKLLERYLTRSILSAVGLVTLLLMGLQIFILFVNQLGDLGQGDFGFFQAMNYVLLQMPYQVYLFFPMASLLGVLMGLGMLANNRELIVMRSAGMSIAQITWVVVKAALVLIILVTFLGETLVPKLSYYAGDVKTQAMTGGQTLRTARGVWLRNNNDFISIETVSADNVLHNVHQFHFDKQHKLRLARKIGEVRFKDGNWHAYNVEQTIIDRNQTQAKTLTDMIWDVRLNPAVLKVSSSEPDEMTLPELNRYIRAQARSHQTAHNFQLAYWQRIIQPLTTVVMMLLAIPFIFGPLRSSTMGARIMAGAMVGFSFHMLNHFFGPISLVMQWSPIIAAIVPTLIFALLGFYLIIKQVK